MAHLLAPTRQGSKMECCNDILVVLLRASFLLKRVGLITGSAERAQQLLLHAITAHRAHDQDSRGLRCSRSIVRSEDAKPEGFPSRRVLLLLRGRMGRIEGESAGDAAKLTTCNSRSVNDAVTSLFQAVSGGCDNMCMYMCKGWGRHASTRKFCGDKVYHLNIKLV
jgi:hypothetical protein